MTQKELEQLFSQYGRIITSRILVDQVTGEYNMKAVHTVLLFLFVFCIFLLCLFPLATF